MVGGMLFSMFGRMHHDGSISKIEKVVVGFAEKFMTAGGLVQMMIIGVIFGVLTAIAGIMTGKQAVKC